MTHESSGAIRAEGEGDRSAEFKESRQRLVTNVNDWLEELSRRQDRGEPLANGMLLLSTPRITVTDLGPSSPHTRAHLIETNAGASLIGDGKETRFAFQLVKPGSVKDTVEVIEVLGSDPLAVKVYGDEFSIDRQLEVLAEYGMRSMDSLGHEQYFTFSFRGDGSVSKKHIAEGAVHSSQPVRDIAGLEMANAALDQVISSVG